MPDADTDSVRILEKKASASSPRWIGGQQVRLCLGSGRTTVALGRPWVDKTSLHVVLDGNAGLVRSQIRRARTAQIAPARDVPDRDVTDYAVARWDRTLRLCVIRVSESIPAFVPPLTWCLVSRR